MSSGFSSDKRMRESTMKAQINQKLDEAGERERLKELLRKRLRECGWRDQLRNSCKEIITEKGLDKVTVEYLVGEITPKARSTVPEQVKRELLQEIRDFLQSSS